MIRNITCFLKMGESGKFSHLPWDGKFPIRSHDVVVILTHDLSKPKVRYFNVVFIYNEDISCSQIPMDNILLAQILHALNTIKCTKIVKFQLINTSLFTKWKRRYQIVSTWFWKLSVLIQNCYYSSKVHTLATSKANFSRCLSGKSLLWWIFR